MLCGFRAVKPKQWVVHSRLISYSKLDNKKITRLETDIELDEGRRLVNRNPRNLEMMAYESKPSGFWLEKTAPSDWNRLVFEQNGKYLDAYIKHWSGKKLIEASTRQANVSKYTNGTNTIQAATVLGRIISHRSLQSGYLYVGKQVDDENTIGSKTKAFYEAVESHGLVLKEPPEIQPRCVTDL